MSTEAMMGRFTPQTLPRLIDCESPKLIAMTTSRGLHVLKVTHYDCDDEDSKPHWSTACSEGWQVDPVEILWWAYADDVQALVESYPVLDAQGVAK
ncbi:hypothetical protein ACVXHM_16810 [Pseudomonas aeruginosa]|jgi:hypothetical protein|uniref:hypothetical protein n=1 Tax=Ectopseudomonas guguanensis TaxID=1198456 RepID=UPI001F4CEBC5|nr:MULTISPECIES: hypothetical protein [Pseudomonas]MCV4061285.1 hypothetical protein [Pseudomonas aeruginosa]MCV4077230.1 hypothetical protein [Pseudomonas aeruginosa]MCV4148699.1 hypothetical protein [Pseudomonas aeruginosa]MCV4180498.1 hypothetical protein [Pseudomonas aeruginosa]MCV4219961.1 hypothetical protein [Pseudomonas aeruginosa]